MGGEQQTLVIFIFGNYKFNMEEIISLLDNSFVELNLIQNSDSEKDMVEIKSNLYSCNYTLIYHFDKNELRFSFFVEDVGIFLYEKYDTSKEFWDDIKTYLKEDVRLIVKKLDSKIIEKEFVYKFKNNDMGLNKLSFRKTYKNIWFWQKKDLNIEEFNYLGYSLR
jgi:hypothetical protein